MPTFWNQRFSSEEYIYGTVPSAYFKQVIDILKQGKLLVPGDAFVCHIHSLNHISPDLRFAIREFNKALPFLSSILPGFITQLTNSS